MSGTSPPYPISDHCDGHRFFNPGIDTDKGLGDLLRWRRTRSRVEWPKHLVNPPYPPPPDHIEPEQIAFTFIGQATYLIRLAAYTILTDPVFSKRASPLSVAGPMRVRDPGIAPHDLPPIDLVLLSHNHYDHMDLPSLRMLRDRSNPQIVTGLGNGAYLARNGIPNAVELDWWGSIEPRADIRVTYVPAQHWSSRSMWDRRAMLWGGHVVETQAGRIYFAGDSGFFEGFQDIRARCGAPDVALLPIGAYEPRWFMKSQHMNPDDAVQAHQALGAGLSLATHWGTFKLTDEGINQPIEDLNTAKTQYGLAPDAFVALLPGETIVWRKTAPEHDLRFP